MSHIQSDKLAALQAAIKQERRLYFIESTTNKRAEVLKEIRLKINLLNKEILALQRTMK
jgi:uncharacterized lipoprotein YbaY